MKNQYFQTIRGILILFVIAIHSITSSNNEMCNLIYVFFKTILNVAVPFFLVLAGYFFNENKHNEDYKYIFKKVIRLLIPLIIYNFIYFILIDRHNIKNLLTFSSACHLYYIVVIIQLIILTPVLLKHRKSLNILMIITPMYLLIYRITWIIKGGIVIPLHQYYFFAWSIYYVIGLLLRKYNISINKITLIISFIFSLTYNIFIYKILGIEYALSQMNIINMIFSLMVAVYFINNKKDNIKSNILSKFGDVSLGIYFIHLFIIGILNKIFSFVFFIPIVSTFLKIFVTIVFSYGIIVVFKKITKNRFDKYLGF